jgi:hypothetical protein
MKCINCGSENRESAHFCRECGDPLTWHVVCPECQNALDLPQKFCDQCGCSLVGLPSTGKHKDTKAKQDAETQHDGPSHKAPIDAPLQSTAQTERASPHDFVLALSAASETAETESSEAKEENVRTRALRNSELEWYEHAIDEITRPFDFGWHAQPEIYMDGSPHVHDARIVVDHFAEAKQWYTEVVARHDSYAMTRLGLLYAQGRGVPKDHVRAHMWWILAEEREDEVFGTNEYGSNFFGDRAEDYRDYSKLKLTPLQDAEAKERARKCRASGYKLYGVRA